MPFRGPSSTAEVIAFAVFAAVALLGALATVTARNPIRSAVGLFFHVLSLGGLYLVLSAHFLAIIQLIVYAGAVVVLFVFVIMILGPAADTPRDRKGIAVRAVGALGVVGAAALVLPHVGFIQRVMVTRPVEYGGIWQMGHALFNDTVLPFELVGVLLTVAMIGAMAIGRGPARKTLGEPDTDEPKHGAKRAPARLVAPLNPLLPTTDAKLVDDAAPTSSSPESHS